MTDLQKFREAWAVADPADRPALEAKIRERRGDDDDHFYGAWWGGSGGRGSPKTAAQKHSAANVWTSRYGEYGSRGNPAAILPTDSSINLKKPDGNWLYDSWTENGKKPAGAGSALVMFKLNDNRTRPTRVVMTAGSASHYKLGQEMHFAHDQTGAYMGGYKIVGIKDFTTGMELGEIPDRKIKMQVFK